MKLTVDKRLTAYFNQVKEQYTAVCDKDTYTSSVPHPLEAAEAFG